MRIKIGDTEIIARNTTGSNVSQSLLPVRIGSHYPILYLGQRRVFPCLDDPEEYRLWRFTTAASASCTYVNCVGSIKANGEGYGQVKIYTEGSLGNKLLNPTVYYLPNDGVFGIVADDYYKISGSNEMTVYSSGKVTAPNRGTVLGEARSVLVGTTSQHREDPVQGGTWMMKNGSITGGQVYDSWGDKQVRVWQEANRLEEDLTATSFDLPLTEDNEILMSNGFGQSTNGWRKFDTTTKVLNSEASGGQLSVYSETYDVTYTYTSGADGGSGTETLRSDWYAESGETTMEASQPIVDSIVLQSSPSWLEIDNYGTALLASGNTANTCRSTTAVCTYGGHTKTVTIKQCRCEFLYGSYNIHNIRYLCDDGSSYITINDNDTYSNIEVTDYTLVTFQFCERNKYWSDWDANRTGVGRGGTVITNGTYESGNSFLYCYLEGDDADNFGICLPKRAGISGMEPDLDHYNDAIDLTNMDSTFSSDGTRFLYVAPVDPDDVTSDMECRLVINAYYSKAEHTGIVIDMETETDITRDYGDQAHELIVGEKRILEIEYVEP